MGNSIGSTHCSIVLIIYSKCKRRFNFCDVEEKDSVTGINHDLALTVKSFQKFC